VASVSFHPLTIDSGDRQISKAYSLNVYIVPPQGRGTPPPGDGPVIEPGSDPAAAEERNMSFLTVQIKRTLIRNPSEVLTEFAARAGHTQKANATKLRAEEVARCWSPSRMASITPCHGSSFGRRIRCCRRYPSGMEYSNMLLTVFGASLNSRATARRLLPATGIGRCTRAYSSTVYIPPMSHGKYTSPTATNLLRHPRGYLACR